jgi:hypothetical protein
MAEMKSKAGVALVVLATALSVIVTASSASASVPHLIGCNESGTVRPARFNPICNDGAGTVIKLRWSGWAGSAHGHGKFYTHICVPDCAHGKVRLYRVKVSELRQLSVAG